MNELAVFVRGNDNSIGWLVPIDFSDEDALYDMYTSECFVPDAHSASGRTGEYTKGFEEWLDENYESVYISRGYEY